MEDIKQQILEAYHFRHATKKFDPTKKISDEDFNFILETARLSPSSFGFEPWNIVVLQNMRIREALLPYTWGAQGTLPTASHFLLITAKTKNALAADSEHITHMMKDIRHFDDDMLVKYSATYQKFLTSDFKLLENDRAVWDWAAKSAYIALGNMMTAAAMIGIDSCPIEGFQVDDVEPLLQKEGIVDGTENRLIAMLAFGYRATPPKRAKTRRPIDEIVTWVQ